MKKMNRVRLRGSFTIEAAFLMPLVLVCIVFLIYLGFYWYDCALCTGACRNASRLLAVSDNAFSLTQEQMLLKERTIALQGLQMEEISSLNAVTVTAAAQIEVPFFGKAMSVYAEQSAYIPDRRAFILKCRLMQGVFE